MGVVFGIVVDVDVFVGYVGKGVGKVMGLN